MIPLKDNLSCKVFPFVTWLFIALNCCAFFIEATLGTSDIESFFNTWAFVPAKFTQAFSSGDPGAMFMALTTVVTAMFLHGGIAHIFGNMIFLQAFGKAVEARMGSVAYAALYVMGGFAANALQYLTDPSSTVPCLGASGAIAFVLGAYLVYFPKADFKCYIPPVFVAVIQAYWLLIGWFALQLMNGIAGLAEASSGGGVAYFAHIGGFLFGIMIAAGWSFFSPTCQVCYEEISCDCNCSGECKKKNHVHRFGLMHLRSDSQGCKGCNHHNTK